MKKVFLFCCYLIPSVTFSQYQIDLVTRQSPDRATFQKIGFTDIEIKYGSPIIIGRVIWGDLVPYDKIWRAGANYATAISFSQDVTIEGTIINGINL